jgi:hypothetical protein
MLYLVTFTIYIPQMLAYIYIPYMDPMGLVRSCLFSHGIFIFLNDSDGSNQLIVMWSIP